MLKRKLIADRFGQLKVDAAKAWPWSNKRLTVALAVVGLVLLFTCNPFVKKPSVPVVTGPDAGVVGIPLEFKATSTDPNGDSVAFMFDWGDTTTKVWTDFVPSGETVSVFHAYAESSGYVVRAKAKNAKAGESGWSDGLPVALSGIGYGYPDSLAHVLHLPYGTKVIAVSRDGSYLYSLSSYEHYLLVTSTATYAILDSVELGGTPTSLSTSPDGDLVYITVPDLDSLVIVRTEDYTVVRRVAAGRGPHEIAVAPGGDLICVVGADSIGIYRTSDYSLEANVLPNLGFPDVQVSPTLPEGYLTSSTDSTLLAFSTATGSVLRILKLPARGTAIGISRDGRRLYVGGDDARVRIVSVDDWRIMTEVQIYGLASQIAATPDSNYVVIANFDSRGLPVMRADRDVIVGLLTPGWPVSTIAVTPDAERIFGSTHEGSTCVYQRR